MKQVYGGQWLGDLLITRLKEASAHIEDNCHGLVTISDSGRREECEPIVKAFGASNCLVFSVQRSSSKWSDNREPIDLRDMGVSYCWLANERDLDLLKSGTKALLEGVGFWPTS